MFNISFDLFSLIFFGVFLVTGIVVVALVSASWFIEFIKWLKYRFKSSKESDIDDLAGDQVPFFVSRFYFHTYKKHMSLSEKVISFLFPGWYFEHHLRTVEYLFRGGYCWHFAHILKETFNRGEVCWGVPHSHFVWMDEDGVCWDICGRVHPCQHSFFIPEGYLPDDILFIFKQANYKEQDIRKPGLDEYMEIIDRYAMDNGLTYDREFVSEMVDRYMIRKETRNRADIQEKSAVRKIDGMKESA